MTLPTSPPTREGSRADLRERVASLQLPPPQRRSGGGAGAWLLVLLLLVTNAATGYTLYRRMSLTPTAETPAPEATAAASESDSPEAAGDAGSAPPAPAPGAVALESKGYVVPAHQILVSPKVSGMVIELSFEEGLRVTRGDVLAVIEQTEYLADRDRAQATLNLMKHRLLELERGSRPEEIAQAEAELAEAQATLAETDREFQRATVLARQNAATEQTRTLAESQFLAQKQRVARLNSALALLKEGPRIERIDAARAEVKQAEAELARAEWRLGNCTIRAPISGTILKKNAEEGNIVNPIAFNGSFSLCDLADLSDLEVQLDIQERDISRVFVGQKCTIRADAYPDRRYEGFVDRLLPIADRAKGAVPVRVKVHVPAEEEGMYLKPEMGALVTFYSG